MGTEIPAEDSLSKRLSQIALDCGFTRAGELNPGSLKPRPEVRSACAADKCKSYGKSWSCPPVCGSLEDCEKIMRAFERGLILQTSGNLEDSFDYEGIQKIGDAHREHLRKFQAALIALFASVDSAAKNIPPRGFLLLGAGACVNCEQCAYPAAPCRFPAKMIMSMEAAGLVVSEVCAANNIPYYYGPNTLTYVGCALF